MRRNDNFLNLIYIYFNVWLYMRYRMIVFRSIKHFAQDPISKGYLWNIFTIFWIFCRVIRSQTIFLHFTSKLDSVKWYYTRARFRKTFTRFVYMHNILRDFEWIISKQRESFFFFSSLFFLVSSYILLLSVKFFISRDG